MPQGKGTYGSKVGRPKIKRYKDGEVTTEDAEISSVRKPSIYITNPTEKGEYSGETIHGDVVEGVRRNRRTIGQKKKESQKSLHQKEDLKERKARNKRRVRKVEKWETGQGPKYKGGKGFKPRKNTRTYPNNTYEEGK